MGKKSILTVLVSFLVLFPVIPSTTPDSVNYVCSDGEFYKTAFRSDPRAAGADLKTVAQIGIDLTASYVKSTISLVKSLLAKGPSMKNYYLTCLDVYDLADYDLKRCPAALKNQDYNSLNTYASAVSPDVDTCDDDFTTIPEELKQAGEKLEVIAGATLKGSVALQKS